MTGAADPLTGALEQAAEQVRAGQPVAALQEIAGLLAQHPADPRPYRAAFEALCATLDQPEALAGWDPEAKGALYRRLLLQEHCPERPLIFHHGLASLRTSDNAATAAALASEVTPTVRQMLAGTGPVPEALVIFLLVARGLPGDRVDPVRLRQLHLQAFPRFARGDLALPYSVMFDTETFGANRDEVLAAWPDAAAALAPAAGLGLPHLLLLEWLGGRPLFTAPDGADLLAALKARLGGAGVTDDDRDAARSLILRHWRPGSAVTATETEALGLGGGVVAVATAQPRPAVTPGAETQVARLESRGYQALQALRGKAARLAPMLAGRQRRVKVALCVSGQMRGYGAALETWRQGLLGQAEFHIFVHTWSAIGRAGAQPFRKVLPFEGAAFRDAWRRIGMLEGFETMQARYPALLAALADGSRVDAETLRAAYGAREVVVDDETRPEFAGFTNQDKMHFKIHAADALARASGEAFDLVLRLRPDLSLGLVAFDWSDMAAACAAGPVIFADKPFGVHYGQPMIGDQVALGSPEAMGIYAGTWKTYRDLAGLGLAAAPERFEGHLSLAQTCWLTGIDIRRIPVRMGTLLDPEPLSAAAIRQALETDSAGRGDAIDRELLAAAAG